MLLSPSVPKDGKWHWHETTSGPVMRRRDFKGYIEYRPMTEDERDQYMRSRAGW